MGIDNVFGSASEAVSMIMPGSSIAVGGWHRFFRFSPEFRHDPQREDRRRHRGCLADLRLRRPRDLDDSCLVLIELAPEVTLDEVRAATAASLIRDPALELT